MTTFAQETVTCGACRFVFKHHVLASTNTFGSCDLDTRPPEMQRSTMSTWIQRCPSCGYSARDITQFNAGMAPVLHGPEYQAHLTDPRYPDLANHFLCAAMLMQAVGQAADAGWAMLHAAWVLDDAKKDELARLCRSDAADSFVAALAAGETLGQQAGASEAIIVDCLRRAGRGGEALTVIDRALASGCDGIIKKVLVFERSLIECGDTSCHLVSDALSD